MLLLILTTFVLFLNGKPNTKASEITLKYSLDSYTNVLFIGTL